MVRACAVAQTECKYIQRRKEEKMMYVIKNKAEEAIRKVVMGKRKGSAVIGEVLVMIVVVAMAAIFKTGGLAFIQQIWTTVTSTAAELFS